MTDPNTSPVEAILDAGLHRIGIDPAVVDPTTVVPIDVEYPAGEAHVDAGGLDAVWGGQ